MELQKDEEWDLKKGKGSFPKRKSAFAVASSVEKSFSQD
jgi:hypothetical protein